MSSQVHIHIRVSDLAKSREFYQKFFGVPPVKERVGYIKFLSDFAPINLALSECPTPAGEGVVHHLGIQVDSTETVMDHLARVKATGLPVWEEIGVDCCHANQDKFWVQDPDGVEWEIYHLNYDLAAASPADPCCAAAPAPLTPPDSCGIL
ncbi:MAG: ArsI/CadI family heavy metal resistance metalloenzyme [Candidatus Methylomirabilales bacterium]